MIFKITFYRFPGLFWWLVIAILIRGQLKNVAQIIIFDELTLYMRGNSFMLILMSANSSKVLKESIIVSNDLDPDQDRRRSLSGTKLFAKVISRWRKSPLIWLIFNSLNAFFIFFYQKSFWNTIRLLNNLYQDQDPPFVGQSWSWFKRSEKVISRHRLSEASEVRQPY